MQCARSVASTLQGLCRVTPPTLQLCSDVTTQRTRYARRLQTVLNASGSYSLALALGGQPLMTPPFTPLTISPGPCCSSCTLLTSQSPSPQAGQAFRFSFQLLDSFANPCQGSDLGFAPWGFAVGIRGPGGLGSWGTAAPAAALGRYEGQYTPTAAGQYNITVLPLHWLDQVHNVCVAVVGACCAACQARPQQSFAVYTSMPHLVPFTPCGPDAVIGMATAEHRLLHLA